MSFNQQFLNTCIHTDETLWSDPDGYGWSTHVAASGPTLEYPRGLPLPGSEAHSGGHPSINITWAASEQNLSRHVCLISLRRLEVEDSRFGSDGQPVIPRRSAPIVIPFNGRITMVMEISFIEGLLSSYLSKSEESNQAFSSIVG